MHRVCVTEVLLGIADVTYLLPHVLDNRLIRMAFFVIDVFSSKRSDVKGHSTKIDGEFFRLVLLKTEKNQTASRVRYNKTQKTSTTETATRMGQLARQ